MREMGLWNMTLTPDIVRVMAGVRKVWLRWGVKKIDWRMVVDTLNNWRKEKAMVLEKVVVEGRENMPPFYIRTQMENIGVKILGSSQPRATAFLAC